MARHGTGLQIALNVMAPADRDQEVEGDLPPGDDEVWKRWKEFV
ncbi:MAG: hypothetical protein AMXMBFR59_42790 [Rhodanobacteraceae bacterium]